MAKLNAQGTSSNTFQIGKRGPLFRSLLGFLAARGADNANFTELQAADPTTDDSLATKRYVDANAGGGAIGTAVIDFGPFPGSTEAMVNITGQLTISASSKIEAQLYPLDTADHSVDEHLLDGPNVFATNIVPTVGFTIRAFTDDEFRKWGQWSVLWKWR